MKTRIITAVVGVPILLVLSYLGGWLLALALALLAGVGAFECGRLLQGKGWRVLQPLAVGAAALIALALAWLGWAAWPFYVALLLVAAAYALADMRAREQEFHGLRQLVGVFYIGIGFGALAALRLAYANWALILFAFLNVWLTDSAAYFVGKRFGRHHLAPTVSPKKTWEGAICGALAALLVCGTYLALVLHMNWSRAFGLALLFSALGQVGDLLESAVKRWAGVKDTGNILPGHGGILDRFDSLLLTAPVILLLLYSIP